MRCLPGSAFGSLHSLVRNFVRPYFHSIRSQMKSKEAKETDDIATAEKAITDFETLLSHLEQDTDIPIVEMIAHPQIVAIVEQVPCALAYSFYTH